MFFRLNMLSVALCFAFFICEFYIKYVFSFVVQQVACVILCLLSLHLLSRLNHRMKSTLMGSTKAASNLKDFWRSWEGVKNNNYQQLYRCRISSVHKRTSYVTIMFMGSQLRLTSTLYYSKSRLSLHYHYLFAFVYVPLNFWSTYPPLHLVLSPCHPFEDAGTNIPWYMLNFNQLLIGGRYFPLTTLAPFSKYTFLLSGILRIWNCQDEAG